MTTLLDRMKREGPMELWPVHLLQEWQKMLKAAELPDPYTVDDVKTGIWRPGALKHHPDHGGDPKEFVKLVETAEMLNHYAGQHAAAHLLRRQTRPAVSYLSMSSVAGLSPEQYAAFTTLTPQLQRAVLLSLLYTTPARRPPPGRSWWQKLVDKVMP